MDVVDVHDNKIIKKNIKLHQGSDERDLSTELWSIYPDVSKAHIRPILKKLTKGN